MTEDVKPAPTAADPSVDDLRAARAKLDQQIAAAEQKEANHAHFHDAEGNVIPAADLNDAMLRAAGIAMEKRSKSINWTSMDSAACEFALHSAIDQDDYVGAALYAAALNAITTIGG